MILITVASWEDRFLLGVRRILASDHISEVLVFYYHGYARRTKTARDAVERLCAKNHIRFQMVSLKFEKPVESWLKVRRVCMERGKKFGRVLLDISTMPRDIIWSLLDFLHELQVSGDYIYNKPAKYASDWLSRDPGNPRLVYKLGGVPRLGLRTTLLVVTGFDIERTQQLIDFFDPKETLLAIQTGPQFDNLRMNVSRHREYFSGTPDIRSFDIDAYSGDHGFSIILRQLKPRLRKANVIMTSLGPKLSAIALFRLHLKYPEVGLTYTPSKDYNLRYSTGISEYIRGPLP